MRRRLWGAACALLVAGAIAGCDDFLSGPGLTTNPNNPSEATRDQLLIGVQLSQFVFQEGHPARAAAMWTQQMAGVGNQLFALDEYGIDEATFQSYWAGQYIGGGLADLLRIKAEAQAVGDRVYLGVAKVWEAFIIGTTASIWGDVPYAEAVSAEPKPRLDSQAEVYAAVQALLDEAIADLQSGSGPGPRTFDLVYDGDAQRWVEAAYTLKARYYIHWSQVQNRPEASTACGGSCAERAVAAAQNGISAVDHDFRTFHTATAGEENIWYQFDRDRPTHIRAGRFLVDLLKARNDPRLTEYFAPALGGSEVLGARPRSSADAGASFLSATRAAREYRQPLITYAENQLILAEAQSRLNAESAALAHLNDARAAAGLGGLSGLSGAALLREIMTEKYIALFQNLEVWNDYKRTCIPAITPFEGRRVPGRFHYANSERNNNPNIPAPSEAKQRNDNDPGICTADVIGQS